MKKIFIFLALVLLSSCTREMKIEEKREEVKSSKYEINFKSKEVYGFNSLDAELFSEDGKGIKIKLSEEMIEEVVKLLSNLEKSKEENHQALHNGDILLLFDNDREINYEYLRICDIKPYASPPKRYYSFESEDKKVDGVYETDLDLLKEIYKILKINK